MTSKKQNFVKIWDWLAYTGKQDENAQLLKLSPLVQIGGEI